MSTRERRAYISSCDEPAVALGTVLGALYDRAGYDLRIDYRRESVPPLAGDDAAWAAGLLGGRT